jgi:short-subunit dehydrogenase involved in D-alanine esterification of teichoic acids
MSNPLSKPATVLLTGATSGVGASLMRLLLAQGHQVIAPARRAAHMPAVSGLIPVSCDLTDLEALEHCIPQWRVKYADISIVINCAAVQHAYQINDSRSRPAHLIDEATLNLLVPALLCQAFLPQIAGAACGAIVNISSGLAVFPKQEGGLYSASKAGLSSFTTALRWQCQTTPVLVTEVILPLVNTPMTAGRGRMKMSPDQAAKGIIAGICARKEVIRIGSARALPVLQAFAPWIGRRILRGT